MMMAEGQAFRLSLCKGEAIKGYEWVGTNNINSSSYPQDERWCGPEHDPHACKDGWFGNIVFQKALSSDVHGHDAERVAVLQCLPCRQGLYLEENGGEKQPPHGV